MFDDLTLQMYRWQNGELSDAEILGVLIAAIAEIQMNMLKVETDKAENDLAKGA